MALSASSSNIVKVPSHQFTIIFTSNTRGQHPLSGRGHVKLFDTSDRMGEVSELERCRVEAKFSELVKLAQAVVMVLDGNV